MDRINPYAVMRNTATYDAYRARTRDMMRAGQPYISLGLMTSPMMPIVMAVGRHFFHGSPAEWTWVLGSLLAVSVLGGAFLVVGCLRIARYRREHPIPEEWRQVPAVRWPPGPAQRPRLRPRG